MPEMPKVSMKYMIPEENPIKFSNIKNFFDRKKKLSWYKIILIAF